jgi:hypothetical protein
MALRLVPMVTGVAVGAVDGFLANQDTTQGRTQLTQQWSFWGEVIALGGGAVLAIMSRPGQIGEDVGEGLVVGAGALLTKRAVQSLVAPQLPSPPPGGVQGWALPRAGSYTPVSPYVAPYAQGQFVETPEQQRRRRLLSGIS